MSSPLVPKDPTPAQRQVLASDWFKTVLEESETIASTSSRDTLLADAMPEHSFLANALRIWSANSPADPQAHAVAGGEKEAWGSAVIRIMYEEGWKLAFHPPHLETLKDLTLAICLLHPRLDLVCWNAFQKPPTKGYSALVRDLFAQARRQVEVGGARVEAVQKRQEAAAQLDETTRAKIAQTMFAKFYPKGELISFFYSERLDREWLAFSDVDPVTLLTCAFEALHARVYLFEEKTAAPEAAAQFALYVCWYLAINALESTPDMRAERHRFAVFICYLYALAPVRFIKSDNSVFFDSQTEWFASAETLSACTALLGQAGQSTLLSQLLISQFYEKQTWTENAKLLVNEGRSFEEAALNLWLLGAKRDRDTLLSEYIDKHVSTAHVMPVLLDALELKPTSTRLKVIHELLARPHIKFDAAQQRRLADAAAKVLKGKALKSLLRFTPDIDPVTLARTTTTPAPSSDTKKEKKTMSTTKKKSETVHPVLDGIKAKKLPKNIDAKLGASLTWRDEKRPVSEAEFATLITVLRECGPDDAHHPKVAAIVAKLEPKALSDLGFVLLAAWENEDSPAKDKWMLFQLCHTGDKKRVTKLGKAHHWESWASSGKWARAQWYLDVVGAMGPSKENDELFISLLDAGHVDSTLQMAARRIFPKFSKSLGYKNVQKYFVERGLLGHVPTPGKLPFEPGKTKIELDGQTYVLLVDQAQLRLQRQSDHHKMNLTEEMLVASKALQRHAEVVFKHAMQWGAFYERKHRLKQAIGFEAARSSLAKNGPVHQDIFCSLLWTNEGGKKVFRFDPEGTCFDVAYEPVSVSKGDKIRVLSLSSLKGAQKKAWLEHLTESEVILPFDLLDSAYYVARLDALMKSPFDTSAKDYADVVWALGDQGYSKGQVEDNGIVWTHYKTLPNYNVRVFFHHTGVDVSNDITLESPGRIEKVEFTDLLGKSVSPTKVEPGALAIICDDLATFLENPF